MPTGRFYWRSGGSPTSLLAGALHAGCAVEIVPLVGRHHEARGLHVRPVAQAFLSGGSDVSDIVPPPPRWLAASSPPGRPMLFAGTSDHDRVVHSQGKYPQSSS